MDKTLLRQLISELDADPSAQNLINAAVPMLESVLGMWVVGQPTKKIVRALLVTLQGPDGQDVAAKVAKNYNPYNQEDAE